MQSCLEHRVDAKLGRLYETEVGQNSIALSYARGLALTMWNALVSDPDVIASKHGAKGDCTKHSTKANRTQLDQTKTSRTELVITPSASVKPLVSVTCDRPIRESQLTPSLVIRHSTKHQDCPSELRASLKTYQKALATARTKNNWTNQVNILKRIGIIHCKLGEQAWGIKCLKQSLQLAQALGDRVNVSIILNYLGAAYRQTGQEHKALRVYLRALEIVNELGNEPGAALLLNHLGEVYNSLGQLEQALLCSRQALETFQNLGTLAHGEGAALHNIGESYLQMKRYRQALAFLEQALGIYQKVGNRKGKANVLESIATVYVKLNQEQRALDIYQQVLAIRKEVGDLPKAQARCLDYIGAVYYKLDNPVRALWHHLQALGIMQAYNYTARIDRYGDDRMIIGKLLQNLLSVYDRLGLHKQGVICYHQAVEIVEMFGENACEEAIWNYLTESPY
jgi:tetratricopeptide (TPR) repeat protein